MSMAERRGFEDNDKVLPMTAGAHPRRDALEMDNSCMFRYN